MDVSTILLLVAVVLFGVAAFNVKAPVHLGWAGACFLALSLLL